MSVSFQRSKVLYAIYTSLLLVALATIVVSWFTQLNDRTLGLGWFIALSLFALVLLVAIPWLLIEDGFFISVIHKLSKHQFEEGDGVQPIKQGNPNLKCEISQREHSTIVTMQFGQSSTFLVDDVDPVPVMKPLFGFSLRVGPDIAIATITNRRDGYWWQTWLVGKVRVLKSLFLLVKIL